MFSRVNFIEAAPYLGLIGFLLTLGAFIYLVVRALRMKKKKRDYMAHLPLEEQFQDKPADLTNDGQRSQ